jgi:pseudouridine-5'-phosphate glycosidase/drug/metabolite transporter (DMT)-like permease
LHVEEAIREEGAIPATIGIIGGEIIVGLNNAQLELLASADNVRKVSRRDFGIATARKGHGATTVAGTMIAAHLAGIRVFATGGIGGVHRGDDMDISADLPELARTPVAVVCAGAKSILDLPRTLEWLETAGVPVIGYQTDTFPAFYSTSSGLPVDVCANTPIEAAQILRAKWSLGLEGGALVVVPPPAHLALPAQEMEAAVDEAIKAVDEARIRGKEITPSAGAISDITEAQPGSQCGTAGTKCQDRRANCTCTCGPKLGSKIVNLLDILSRMSIYSWKRLLVFTFGNFESYILRITCSITGVFMPHWTSAAPPRLQLIAAFATVYLIWGSTYLAIRYAIETMPPFFMAGVRFLIAGGILFVWARLQGAPLPTRINWRAAAIIGGLLLFEGNGGVTWAEQSVPSGLVALMVALVPVWVTLIDWLRPNGIRPSGPMIAGVIMGFIGMVLLILSGQSSEGGSQINLPGALVVMGATLAWSIGSVYSRHAPLPDAPLMATAMEMLAGGILLSLASPVVGEWPLLDLGTVSLKSWLALVYLIVFGSIIAFSAYTWLLKVTSPVRAATYAMSTLWQHS